MRSRVETRIKELELALSTLASTDRARAEVENALDAVRGLLTGDLDRIPHVVAIDLSNWLEANKHVNERHVDAPVESDATNAPTDAASDKP